MTLRSILRPVCGAFGHFERRTGFALLSFERGPLGEVCEAEIAERWKCRICGRHQTRPLSADLLSSMQSEILDELFSGKPLETLLDPPPGLIAGLRRGRNSEEVA